MANHRPRGGRLRVGLPPLSSIGQPPFGEVLYPVPAGISSEAKIVIGGETITVNAKDLKKQANLGHGYYGHVEQMIHVPSKHVFAVKHIRIIQENVNKTQIQKDLAVGMRSSCPSVVTCYCGLFYELEVLIVMELMDTSLDKLLEKIKEANRSFPENILAYAVHCVVTGLEYLHKELKVIHRDVKPSNMLANRQGMVKVCDFGISGDLVNSLAQSNLGSKMYLAPERIDVRSDRGFRIQSDVWSLGLSVMELATGKPCYSSTEDVFQQLDLVVKRDPPRLPEDGTYSEQLCQFTAMCLVKEEQKRANYVQLLNSDFLREVDPEVGKTELKEFICDFLGKPT
ncbi:unnamed protein product [Calicophoron daubneyi]|uniref:mitogen-activated protein kinase kinase n=1 Tax=Calicophoron daubneyi TaxID=300641 RepID=A0AAV2T6Z5_CALDB